MGTRASLLSPTLVMPMAQLGFNSGFFSEILYSEPTRDLDPFFQVVLLSPDSLGAPSPFLCTIWSAAVAAADGHTPRKGGGAPESQVGSEYF